jgi:hypothetical protein
VSTIRLAPEHFVNFLSSGVDSHIFSDLLLFGHDDEQMRLRGKEVKSSAVL